MLTLPFYDGLPLLYNPPIPVGSNPLNLQTSLSQGTNPPAPPLFPLSEVKADPMSKVAKPPQANNKGQNPPFPLFPVGQAPISSVYLNLKTRDNGNFRNGPKEFAREILLGLFEEIDYNK